MLCVSFSLVDCAKVQPDLAHVEICCRDLPEICFELPDIKLIFQIVFCQVSISFCRRLNNAASREFECPSHAVYAAAAGCEHAWTHEQTSATAEYGSPLPATHGRSCQRTPGKRWNAPWHVRTVPTAVESKRTSGQRNVACLSTPAEQRNGNYIGQHGSTAARKYQHSSTPLIQQCRNIWQQPQHKRDGRRYSIGKWRIDNFSPPLGRVIA